MDGCLPRLEMVGPTPPDREVTPGPSSAAAGGAAGGTAERVLLRLRRLRRGEAEPEPLSASRRAAAARAICDAASDAASAHRSDSNDDHLPVGRGMGEMGGERFMSAGRGGGAHRKGGGTQSRLKKRRSYWTKV